MRRITGIVIAATLAGQQWPPTCPSVRHPPTGLQLDGPLFWHQRRRRMGAAGPIQYSNEPFRSCVHQLQRGRGRRNGWRSITDRSCRSGFRVGPRLGRCQRFIGTYSDNFRHPGRISVNATTNINWDLTARTRVGYAQDNWLFFATFGVAVLGAKTNLTTLSGLDLRHIWHHRQRSRRSQMLRKQQAARRGTWSRH